jgi:hypothetical protein
MDDLRNARRFIGVFGFASLHRDATFVCADSLAGKGHKNSEIPEQ